MTHGGGGARGPWQAPGQKGGRASGIWWILGVVCLVGLLVIVGGIVAFVVVVSQAKDSGSTSSVAGTIPSSVPLTPPDGSVQPEATAPDRERSPSFPQVRPAEDLPPGEVMPLGVEVAVETSDLRYAVMDVFETTIYNCVFSAHIRNLTDQPFAATMAFRTTGAPHAEWAGGAPVELGPGEETELVLGWDGASPAEVGVTESECAGPVELTRLVVEPG